MILALRVQFSLLEKDQHAALAAEEIGPRACGVTRRAVLLCLGLAAFFGYVIPIVDVKLSNTFMGAQHLPPSAIGVLLVLLLFVNPLLQLLDKHFKFSRAEMLTVYISCLFSTLVPGQGGETLFLSQMIAPFYYATRENGWVAQFQGNLQPWMSPALWADGGTYGPRGQEAVAGWFNGLAPGASIPWAAWLVPLTAWGALIFAMYAALACISVMLRAQWGEHEALAFPLLRLPLEMTEDVDSDKYGTLGRFFVKLGYDNGALSLGSWFFVKVGSQFPAWWSDDMMRGVKDAGWINAAWLGSGALFMMALMTMRARASVGFRSIPSAS